MPITKFNDVKNITTEEYFNNNHFSIDAFNKKYKLKEKETYVQGIKKVCDFVASVEKTDKLKKYWSERWFDEIFNDWWHPAGSVMQGAGSGRKISLANCFSQDTEFITDKGSQQFSEFKDGDKVNVLTNYGEFNEATIKNFGKQKLYNLTVMRNGLYKEIKCTINHVWRTLKKDTIINKTTGELNTGDLLPYIKRKSDDGTDKTQWKVISIDETELYEDVWCVVEPKTKNFTLSGGINTHNCTTVSLGTVDEKNEWDSLEGIIKNTAYTVAKTAAYRQGLGVDFSRIRPVGTTILNSANQSTGAIHWMKFIDSIGYYVGQKGRIPAMLFSLSISHPDVEDFIKVKSNYTKIQNANISVQITNDFYDAIKEKKKWTLEFTTPKIKKGDKIYIDAHSANLNDFSEKTGDKIFHYKIATHDKNAETIKKQISAKKLLELIAENMLNNAEPGIQNIGIAREYSNSDAVYDSNDDYDSRILSTNACSEQYLSRDSLCVLSSENAEKFSTDLETFKAEQEKIAESIQRFLDNVNECELVYQTYATPYQKLAIEKLRRTGAGITNIAGWLFKLNLEYGSKEGNEKVEEFIKWYNYFLYKTNIDLGKEKGNFGLFHPEKIKKSKFIQNMIKEFPDLEFRTMRNVTSSSIAPTGTLSLMFRNMVMSYGVEPAFGMYYWKRTRITGKYEYYFIVPYIVRKAFEQLEMKLPMDSDTIRDTWDGSKGKPIVEFIEKNKNKLGIHFKEATEVSVYDKLGLMAKIMKWIDSSISVTYMLPENSKKKDIYNFILKAHERGLKSIAVFPDKKMYGIISFTPFKELAIKLKNENIDIHPQNFNDNELMELNMSNDFISMTSAPKRPKKLDADIYSITIKGEKFVVSIGILNGAPYEIFAGKMNGLRFDFKQKQGVIEKVKRGVYKLSIKDLFEIEDFSKHFEPVEVAIFRMVSTALRHGTPLKFIVEQLNKSSNDIGSLSSAAARVLKKYIHDGETVTGTTCPRCGNASLFYADGCVSCSCGWSRC